MPDLTALPETWQKLNRLPDEVMPASGPTRFAANEAIADLVDASEGEAIRGHGQQIIQAAQ